MSWKAFAKQSLTDNEAKLTRRIGSGLMTTLRQDAEDLQLQITLEAAHAKANSCWLHADSTHGPIKIAQGERLIRALTGIDIPPNPGKEMLDFLNAAILGKLQATPFKKLTQFSFLSIDTALEDTLIQVQLSSKNHTIACHAKAAAATWLNFLKAWKWERPESRSSSYDDWPVRIPVVLAGHSIAIKKLTTLSPGDVLLPRQANFNCHGEGLFRVGGISVSAQYTAFNQLTITDMEVKVQDEFSEYDDQESDDKDEHGEDYQLSTDHQLDTDDADSLRPKHRSSSNSFFDGSHHSDAHTDDPSDNESDDAMLSPEGIENADADGPNDRPSSNSTHGSVPDLGLIDSLTVRLDFELGHLSTTMRKIKAFAPGVVLRIAGGSNADVSIKIDGRRIGAGEIVDINGNLGVRITEWS
jgi:type III secretion protein Q